MANRKVVNFANRNAVKVSKWKVEIGQTVYHGRVLLLYEDEESGQPAKLKSKCVGTVVNLIAKEGELLNPGDPVLEVEEGCSHPTVINDLCAECGADLQREGLESNATVPMVHHIPQLKVSQQEAEMIGKADTARLLKDRKLVLLVDLDQTLIHSTHDNIPNNIKDVHHFQLGTSAWYHTRLRPNTAHFLKEMSAYFELHICTFGVRPYAHMVANILDRDQSLFSNRILSRDECFNYNSKVANLQALFPNGDELVCIIDDRKDVWNYSPNLIPVKPYVFFTNTGDINDPNLPPITKHSDFFAKGVKLKKREVDSTGGETEDKPKESGSSSAEEFDVEDEDDYLLYLETILKKVHELFYKVYDKEVEGQPHVRWVLEQLRGSVLKGCEIVFSGLVPLHEGLEKSEPYLMATDLGAKIGKNVCETTTHIVAAREGTAKLHESKKYSHIKIVNPLWLTTCLYRWEQVDERLFPLVKSKEVEKKGKDMPLVLSLDDVVSMQQEVQAEFNSDSSDSVEKEVLVEQSTVELDVKKDATNGSVISILKNNPAEKNASSLTNPNPAEKNASSLTNPNSAEKNASSLTNPTVSILKNKSSEKTTKGIILIDRHPFKKIKLDAVNPCSSKSTDQETLKSNSSNDKDKVVIDKLLESFKKSRKQPVELDFLKHKNLDSMKKFQIPKKVTISEQPEVRHFDKDEAIVIPNKKKRRKRKSPTKASNLQTTPLTEDTNQLKMPNEYRYKMAQMQEEHQLKKQYLKERLRNQAEQMVRAEHLEMEQRMAEHSLRMSILNEEHQIKMKHLNDLHVAKMNFYTKLYEKQLKKRDADSSDDELNDLMMNLNDLDNHNDLSTDI